MSSRTILALFALTLALPGAAAQAAAEGPDFVVTFHADGTTTYDGPAGLLVPVDSDAGERYSWEIVLTDDYTVGEFRIDGAFEVERVRQIVPTLRINASMPVCVDPDTDGVCQYPLFEWVPREDLRDVDAPVRIVNLTGTPEAGVVRVGLPGPAAVGQDAPLKAELAVERDVTPPAYALGEIENLTHRDLYRQTETLELALGDLQVRKKGTDEWVRNPTTVYHFIQKFPVQGFDPETEYETRAVFTDWAGNQVTSPIETFVTPAKPEVPKPIVTALTPAPNATVAIGESVSIRAGIESPGADVTMEGVRLFYDLAEVHDGFSVENGVLTYVPDAVEPGVHVVSVEVTNVAGGSSYVRWVFTVGDEVPQRTAGEGAATRSETPGAPAGLALLVLGAAALASAGLARRRD